MDDAIHPYIAALRSGQIPFPTILSVPLAGRFAIVRLNPVAMVEHLDDPEALAQARRMVTQKYLVFLERVSIPRFETTSSRPTLSQYP